MSRTNKLRLPVLLTNTEPRVQEQFNKFNESTYEHSTYKHVMVVS